MPPIVAVVGPTAAGKSDLAVALARRLDPRGEVVNADSMQLYRGMDIGTAKLAAPERLGVVHHLLDVLAVTEPSSVADYQRRAAEVISHCRSRGAVPLVVGGSALYVRAVLDGFGFPGTDPALRSALEAEARDGGAQRLHARLLRLDPAAAAGIPAANVRRVVRALEVVELTGRPYAATLPRLRYADPRTVQVGVDLPRELLDRRIDARVARMWSAGLVDEVRGLAAVGLRTGRTASRAVGYAQVLRFLAGECTEEQARQDTARATRRLVRRQEAWFRKDPRVRWLPGDEPAVWLHRALALVRGAAAGGPYDREP